QFRIQHHRSSASDWKVELTGLEPSLCNWILDFLIGSSTSKTTTLSTGTPQGSVLSPLLFTLLSHDCATMHSSNHIRFADHMTVGLICKDRVSREPHLDPEHQFHYQESPSTSLLQKLRSPSSLPSVELRPLGSLPSITDIYTTCIHKAISIVEDPSHTSLFCHLEK
ncbi:hypothetical protein P4O66_011013, partial [Electrophorus voltai]